MLVMFVFGNFCAEGCLFAAETGVERRLALGAFVESLHLPGASDRFAEMRRNNKCGLEMNAFLQSLMPQLSPDRQVQLNKLMGITDLQTSRLIGHFEIHYDTIGSNQPALIDSNGNRIPNSYEAYIDSVGWAFNHTWSIQIDSLHYPPPPFLPGHAGYVVDVLELNAQLYGQTVFESQLNGSAQPALYLTHIEIDNDYVGYYSPGIAGLKVTSAHEFQHSITLGNFGYWTDQIYYYEICATWMETVVYPEVPDYIAYLEAPDGSPRGGFQFPALSFTTADGLTEFSRVVWGKYVEKRYSRGMMRHIWDHVRLVPILTAINEAMQDSGTSFQNAFLEWSLWNYYTGRRADTIHFYTEGRQFPEIAQRDTVNYFSPGGYFTDSVQCLGSSYQPILLNRRNRIFSIISNVNAATLDFTSPQFFTYRMADNTDGTYKRLDSLIYVKLDVPDPVNWKSQESIHGIEAPLVLRQDVIVYPDPLIYPDPRSECNDCLKFLIPDAVSPTAKLRVFSTDFRKIFEGSLAVRLNISNEPEISWNSMTGNGAMIASGIYFYSIFIDDKEYHGKFAVVKK
ncbi:MAG: hypothetical protein ACHQQQ_12320 [Bacteroidota bacterium]